jgi:PEP-CTERM motif-containing protein
MAMRELKRDMLTTLCTAALLMLSAVAARATCIGNCGMDTANGDVTNPPGFTSYQFVTTNGGTTGGGNLPSVFGSPGVNSTDGSTFTTVPFTTTAGELINFEFNYVTSDGSGFPDYAWAGLLSTDGGQNYLIFSAQTQPSPTNTVPGSTLPPLASGASLIMAGSGSSGGPVWAELGSSSGTCFAAGCGLTGWIESLFSGEAADTYTLQFGVSNANDTIFDSGLAFAGVEVGGVPLPTPEPTSMALIGTALFGFGVIRRRRKIV